MTNIGSPEHPHPYLIRYLALTYLVHCPSRLEAPACLVSMTAPRKHSLGHNKTTDPASLYAFRLYPPGIASVFFFFVSSFLMISFKLRAQEAITLSQSLCRNRHRNVR